ncbi:MAG: DUF4276 family protein [Sulfuriferula sp.]|nr:DUF4276 family protein [Sulfuriferula sp.]
MIEVIVFAEGQTEEQFIKQVVAPVLRHLQVFVKPQLLHTSQMAKGGAVTFDRLKFNARNTLRQHPNAVLSTFLDLYALDTDFPALDEAKKKPDVYARVTCIQDALHDAVVAHVTCRPERFIPHIQPYEFEGLLFSDINTLCTVEPTWAKSAFLLNKARNNADTPEHINDGYETKPSKRLTNALLPKYKKTRHGPLIAERITLATIERECLHFASWMNKLRQLAVPA